MLLLALDIIGQLVAVVQVIVVRQVLVALVVLVAGEPGQDNQLVLPDFLVIMQEQLVLYIPAVEVMEVVLEPIQAAAGVAEVINQLAQVMLVGQVL
jgi:hypothetical protein